MDEDKFKKRIRNMYLLIGKAEKRFDLASEHEKPIIEVGLKAIREELLRLLKRRDGQR